MTLKSSGIGGFDCIFCYYIITNNYIKNTTKCCVKPFTTTDNSGLLTVEVYWLVHFCNASYNFMDN